MVEVDPGVVVKLVVFSIALVMLPVGVLQASLHGYLDGKDCSHSVLTIIEARLPAELNQWSNAGVPKCLSKQQ